MNGMLEWQFGGWLRDLPGPLAWTLLGVPGMAGCILIVTLYRRTLRELSPAGRWSLTLLRLGMLLALLLCLANPTRTSVRKPKGRSRTLAVVVDHSDSMTGPDQRGETRLQNALKTWNRHADEAARVFAKQDYYAFSTQLEAAPSLDAAVNAPGPGPETRLYEALDRVVARGPAAIVCLTDGLDTTGADARKLLSAAQSQGVPLYFVAGQNHTRTEESAEILEVETPPKVLRHTQFSASAVMRIVSHNPEVVPVELWSGGEKLGSTELQTRAGLNTIPCSFTVSAGEAGPMPLEFRLGTESAGEIALSTTRIVERSQVDILYYEGALQWGYRFLLKALESDPSFQVTSILEPALDIRMSASPDDPPTMDALPSDAAGLKRFQIVVLAYAFADQLSADQQQALVDYAKAGGGVLFIAPDTDESTAFAGTPLEQMLPVIFEPAAPGKPDEIDARKFQDQMSEAQGANVDGETGDVEAMKEGQLPELTHFSVAAGAPKSAITALFDPGHEEGLPMFSDYARVKAAKPGAEILAVHPTDRTADGAPRILLARQQFGKGFTAVLTTDLLWRWKMSLPSASHATERFWQQLALSLSPLSGAGMRIFRPTGPGSVGEPVLIRVEGSNRQPAVTAIPPRGGIRVLAPTPARGESGAWEARFIPDTGGRWEVRAADTEQNEARISMQLGSRPRNAEDMDLPPDIEGLREIAESTGGALVEDEPVFQQQAEEAAGPKQRDPLWDTDWLLGALLGLYATELMARRRFQLL